MKTDKIWICGSVGKLKVIGNQGEVKMNEINVHTIADFQRYVSKLWVAQAAGKLCPMFDYTEKKIITIDAYKK